MPKPLIYDSGGGVFRKIHVDPLDPYSFVQETVQVFPERLAEENRALDEARPRNPYAGVRTLARGVPVAVWEQSEREQWDEARWNRWLEDPDNAVFRVSREKL